MPIDKHGAQLLFRIISDSYERRSLIITTNMLPDGRGDDRPTGPPWAHPAVRGRKLPDEECPHAAKTLGKNTRGLMGIFRRFFRVFSLD